MHGTYPKLRLGVSGSWGLGAVTRQAVARAAPRESAGHAALRHAAGTPRGLEGFTSDSWSQCWDPLGPSVRATRAFLQLSSNRSTLFFCSGKPRHWVLRDITNRGNPNPVHYIYTTMVIWYGFFLLRGKTIGEKFKRHQNLHLGITILSCTPKSSSCRHLLDECHTMGINSWQDWAYQVTAQTDTPVLSPFLCLCLSLCLTNIHTHTQLHLLHKSSRQLIIFISLSFFFYCVYF